MQHTQRASRPGRSVSGGASAVERRTIPPEIRAQVRHIELRTRALVESLFSGEYHSVFKGRGLEFADVREYQPGDDVRAIDWNVTARRDRPYVKENVEERQLNVLLVVDLSASKQFGSGAKPNARIAAEIASILGLAAATNNDRVGLLLVTDRVELFVAPDTGRRHALRLVLEVLWHRPVGRGTKLSAALEHATRVLRQRTVIFLVSDYLVEPERDPAFERSARRVAGEHDLVAVRLTDPAGARLPDVGMLAVLDPETGERRVVNTSDRRVRQAYHERWTERRDAVTSLLRRLHVDTIEVSTLDDYVRPLLAFFRRRSRSRG